MRRLREEIEGGRLFGKKDPQVVEDMLAFVDAAEGIADINRQIASIPGAFVATEQRGTK
jgi:hypothetical protein